LTGPLTKRKTNSGFVEQQNMKNCFEGAIKDWSGNVHEAVFDLWVGAILSFPTIAIAYCI